MQGVFCVDNTTAGLEANDALQEDAGQLPAGFLVGPDNSAGRLATVAHHVVGLLTPVNTWPSFAAKCKESQ